LILIQYPILKDGATIGVTAPSFGVMTENHELLKLACKRMESKGFDFILGDTAWTQDKAKSAPAKKRANEFNEMMLDDSIQIIIPPWGGELLIEILEYVDFENLQKKWILGYSDISVLLLAITLRTGIATAHGTNLIDLRGDYSDATTAMWYSVLSNDSSESILQQSSKKFQKEWKQDISPCVFHLTEQTYWKTISNNPVKLHGRLLGGCLDVIRHLIGTPYGDVSKFRKQFVNDEPVLWYFENVEMNSTALRRTFVQMKYAGWFDNCSGIMFGRSVANTPVDNYTVEDVYKEISEELDVPIIYDVDCGHMPPQITFINGALAEVNVENGKGTILQRFK
jgi:muramoyltetrapeptide carboxypeptidase